VGASPRAVRVRRGWTQRELARRVGVSHGLVSLVERGHFDHVALSALRRVAAELDVRIDVVARWRGGDLGRLVNARHSALHEAAARYLGSFSGWTHTPEVSFSIYGERGWIDILAWHEASRSLLVIELKTELVDVQEMVGVLDRKHRLAPVIARERGWGSPATTSRWIILADHRTNRRHLAAHATLLRNALPCDGRSMRAWLADPRREVSALSFLPIPNPRRQRPGA
jgi:transcriptional regulator with XRE-family HTH domain